jgi:putative ABC transport system permease protein
MVSADPIGQKNTTRTVVLRSCRNLDTKGQSFTGEDQDDLVVLPLRTVQRRVSGNRKVSMIYVSAVSEAATPRLKESLNRLMRERRRVPTDADEDFSVRDLKEISELIEQTTGVLTAFVSAIAAVSLLVGGIGIMNTTLVTVTERTREIGTRLAIGALEREVLLQFLVEAAVLSAFGGCVGIVFGLTSAAALAAWMEIPYTFDVTIVVGAFVFSALVGSGVWVLSGDEGRASQPKYRRESCDTNARDIQNRRFDNTCSK